MSCKFSIEFPGSAEKLVSKAESVIKGEGGKFSGGTTEGEFSLSTVIGSVKGSYTIEAQTMNISIQDKPVFIPCNKIESVIRKYLTQH